MKVRGAGQCRSVAPFAQAVVAIAIGLATPAWNGASAKDQSPLKPLPPLEIPLDSSQVVVVSPEASEYQTIARKLAEGLSKPAGQTPRVVADSVAPADIEGGPLIVLGNLMDCRAARRLYLHAYDFTDYSWPSPGGHVVRTIRDPFGTGAHVILLGGSDVEGVAQAAKTLLEIVAKQGST